jgi:hypothetical protein
MAGVTESDARNRASFFKVNEKKGKGDKNRNTAIRFYSFLFMRRKIGPAADPCHSPRSWKPCEV